MRRTPSGNSAPKGYMLTSTACIIAVLAFCAGLLGGALIAFETGGGVPAPRASAPAPAQDPAAELADHIAQVRAELERNPSEALNWIHLGNLYFDSHNPAEAIAAYEQALRLQPGNADVMTDLGTMYRTAGNPQKALETYDQALALVPDHQNAFFNKGVTLMIDLARPAEAVAVWRALLDKRPGATLSDGTPLASAMAPLATDAGDKLAAAGHAQAALQAYEQALLVDPQFAPAREHRAALLNRQAASSSGGAAAVEDAGR